MARSSEPVDSAERLVFFTDAVVAIALTLLVLPLVELVPEARRSGLGLQQLLRENLGDLGSFALSFAVIFRFWWSHHGLFRHVSGLSLPLVCWNLLWMFSIVLLPVPTAIITAYHTSPATVLLYDGTLVLSSGSLTMLAITAYRNPALSAGRSRETREGVLASVSSFGALLLALIIGSVFWHRINYWALLLMFLTGPVERVVKRRWATHPVAQLSPGER
ncbi:MAG TPA: TMEM175 family protein [Friedmanniella sp.]